MLRFISDGLNDCFLSCFVIQFGYNNTIYITFRINKIILMKSRPKSAKSQFEVNFETHQTFQRNKQFIDLQKGKTIQRQYSALRRKPLKSQDNHISEKINSSFMNTTAELTQRTHRNIFKHKTRASLHVQSPSILCEFGDTIETITPNKINRGRSFSIQKMTSRQYHHKLKNKIVNDERRFNNFQNFKSQTPLYCQYDKMLPQSQRETPLKPFLDIQYNTQKLYQDYYYKKTTNNCKVDYKSEKKLKSQRVFFKARRPENDPSTQLNPEKVDNGLKIATNFKQSNISRGKIDQFYRNSGRQLPSQSQMRFMNELTNHWKDQTGSIKRKKLDYQTRKMKQDMEDQRMGKIKYSKQAKNQREQMCDQKYFSRFKF